MDKQKVPSANWKCKYCDKRKVYYNTWEENEITPACWDHFIKNRRKEGFESLCTNT